MGNERRNSPRLPYFAEVRVVGAEESYFHPAINLSLGGVFLRTEFPLKSGTRLQVQLTVAAGQSPLELDGTVVWSQLPARPGTPEALVDPPLEAGMGVAFARVSGEVREKLEAVIAALARAQEWDR